MIRAMFLTIAIVLCLCGPRIALATPLPAPLKACGTGTVDKALSGDRLTFKDGRILSLSAIKAPELWPAASPYKSWPHAEASRRQLHKIIAGTQLNLFCEGERKTLDGALVAHAALPDGRWLQHVVVEAGAAFVYPMAGHASGLEALYGAEAVAQAGKRGLWENSRLITTARDDIQAGWFHIVRGRVLSAGKARGQIYLNFGSNWRRDFTVELAPAVLRRFKKAGIDPLTFEGVAIEARGWVDWKGGPRILLESPGQIRVLGSETDELMRPLDPQQPGHQSGG